MIRRRATPSFHHPRIRDGVESRVHLNDFKMLGIPRKTVGRTHPFRIPTLDEPGIRPTRRTNENVIRLDGSIVLHSEQKAHERAKVNSALVAESSARGFMRSRFYAGSAPGRVQETDAILRTRGFAVAFARPCANTRTLKDAGWSSLVARQAHNLKAAGSNPAPATKRDKHRHPRILRRI